MLLIDNNLLFSSLLEISFIRKSYKIKYLRSFLENQNKLSIFYYFIYLFDGKRAKTRK